MPGLTGARQALGRFFAGAEVPAQGSDARAVAGASQVTHTVAPRGLFTWIAGQISNIRGRNEEALIEEAHSVLRAKRRSLTLMLSLLTPEQRQEFRAFRHFHVIGGSTGTLYRIRVASFANMDIVGPNGRTMYRLCAHPAGDVPVYDVMAAQLLHLQDASTERAFLRRANVHPVVSQVRAAPGTFWVP
jgi:hypothetical protein